MPRVAIVGLGPKGMFALERLLDHAAGLSRARIEIDVFEPDPSPGAGPIYDPLQPSYLLMNFAADQLDMWWPTSTTVPRDQRPSFVEWRERLPQSSVGDAYPPRAQAGRYLADGFQTMLRHAPPCARVRLCPARVRTVSPDRCGWRVEGAGSAGRYDEVLIATGHERSWDGGLASAWTHPAVLIPSVFPVRRWLSPDRVAPGATVAARGFALSFIDAALALTQGRGGAFEPLDHPYRLRYSPTDDDAGLILPFSRSGRPMLAKPDPALAAGVPGLDRIAERSSSRILRLAHGFGLQRDLLPILTAAASASLLAARGSGAGNAAPNVAIGDWLAAAAAGVPVPAERGPAEELEHSLAVGAGLSPPDIQWALGHTWRTLYPALVSRLGGDGLREHQWPAFAGLAAEMERVAFGPPALNAAKLLALIGAGRIELTHVRGGRLTSDRAGTGLRSEHGEHAVDVVIDAVLPGPGVRGAHSELLRRLLSDGHVRIAAGRRGLDVGADGACRRPDGSAAVGLSAIGRPTEDAVIGNDTLSRTLHPLADRWARRVVERCREDPVASGVDPLHEGVA